MITLSAGGSREAGARAVADEAVPALGARAIVQTGSGAAVRVLHVAGGPDRT